MRAILVTQAAGYRAPVMTIAQMLARLEVHAPTLNSRLAEDLL